MRNRIPSRLLTRKTDEGDTRVIELLLNPVHDHRVNKTAFIVLIDAPRS